MALRLRIAVLVFACAGAAAAQETPPPPAEPKPPSAPFSYQRGRIEKDGIVTIFYQIGHGRGPMVKPFLLKFLTPKGSIEVSPQAPPNTKFHELHLMMISDVKENIDLIEKVLSILDRPSEQVQIEAQIIEKSVQDDLEIGAEFTMDQKHGDGEALRDVSAIYNTDGFLNSLVPGAQAYQGTSFGIFNRNHQWGVLELKIRAMVRKGRATVLSSPYVTVNSGETATIVAGDDVPYVELITINNGIPNSTIKFKQAAVRLEVTPHVVGGNYIDLEVKPEVTSVSGSVTIGGNPTPVFSTRTADTHLTVQDGQQIVIGGLVRTEEIERRRGIPILADIPILGYLFGSTELEKQKTEVLFIIRPRIIKPAAAKELLVPGGGK